MAAPGTQSETVDLFLQRAADDASGAVPRLGRIRALASLDGPSGPSLFEVPTPAVFRA